MKNAVYNISKKDYVSLKETLLMNDKLSVVELDGREMIMFDQFLSKISEVYDFPFPAKGIDGYLDWIRDLSWIDAEGFALVVHNAKFFLEKEPNRRREIIKLFEEIVCPWWQSEVEQFVVEGKAKSFNVYFVE